MTGPARMEGVPDSGKDPVIARLGVSLPLWGGKAGARKKSSAGWLAAASAELADTRQQLNARLEAVLYAWREAGRNADLYGHGPARQRAAGPGRHFGPLPIGPGFLHRPGHRPQDPAGYRAGHLRAVTDQNHALNDLARLLGVTPEELSARGSESGSG